MLPELILKHLSHRLQVEDWYRRHPEIDDEPIEAPLIGLGLPRTGSTALSILLAEDPDARSLRRWEAVAPCPPPSTVDGPDPRIAEAEAMQEMQEQLAPRMAALVPGSPTGPEECQDLMALDFKAALLPGVRLRALVLGVAARRRPDVHLPVRAPGAQAPAVGCRRPGRGA